MGMRGSGLVRVGDWYLGLLTGLVLTALLAVAMFAAGAAMWAAMWIWGVLL